MAKYVAEVPTELIKQFESIYDNTFTMMGDMTSAGAKRVYLNVQSNMKRAFKSYSSLSKGLTTTRVYRTPSDDGVNCKVGFYGYDPTKVTKKYPNGVPIPLIALAREYGTSSGETKKPFFRKSFKKKEIEDAMLKEQEKYLPKE